jgi:CRISPR-associated protein Cmr3
MAVAVDRWMPVSGWDLQSKKPKAMRKAVPAGSVYWFAVEEGSASDLASLWFTTVGDNAQDNIDGFSQVSVAPWSPVSH